MRLRPIVALRAGGEPAAEAFAQLLAHLQDRYRYHHRLRNPSDTPEELLESLLQPLVQNAVEAKARSALGWGQLDLLLMASLEGSPGSADPNCKAAGHRLITALIGDRSHPESPPAQVAVPDSLNGLAPLPQHAPPEAAPRAGEIWRAERGGMGRILRLATPGKAPRATSYRGHLVHDQSCMMDPRLEFGAYGPWYIARWCPMTVNRRDLQELVARGGEVHDSERTHDAGQVPPMLATLRKILCSGPPAGTHELDRGRS